MHNSECVILLHGLARMASSMEKIEKRLIKAKYSVINVNYPSRSYPLEELAEKVISEAISQCGVKRINFVTHSMGGLLVRQYLSLHKIENLNRVVMLGPPNKGSEIVDKLGDIPGFRLSNGAAGMQLGTDDFSVPKKLGKANFNVGIIAGTKSINWILSTLIPGIDDGKVSVINTKLDGMKDHIELETTHPFMMKNNEVIEQVVHYLRTGKFQHNN
jgi:triacylglycerol esterase/lipase EstA (alpha/beta hydrolase family)